MIYSALIKHIFKAKDLRSCTQCAGVAIASVVLLLSAPFVNPTRHEEIMPPPPPADPPASRPTTTAQLNSINASDLH